MTTPAHEPPSGVARESTDPRERTASDGPRVDGEMYARQPPALLADVHAAENALGSLQKVARDTRLPTAMVRDQYRGALYYVEQLAAGLRAHLAAWPDGEAERPGSERAQ